MKPHRVRVTHDLVGAYEMLPKTHVLILSEMSSARDAQLRRGMRAFHTDEYIDFLVQVTPETQELPHRGMLFLVGLLPDNPAFEDVFEFRTISAGGSIAAVQRISSGAMDIAINWAGGLHNAKKGEASGFCYINDIVLCTLELLRTHPRVLYIDIHHGDGVEEAFYSTDHIMTASFQKFGQFSLGTGTQDDRGKGGARATRSTVFAPVMTKILEIFRPTVVVLQCSAGSRSGDKLGGFALTLAGHDACMQFMHVQNRPLILLGGKNVAREGAPMQMRDGQREQEPTVTRGSSPRMPPRLPPRTGLAWHRPPYSDTSRNTPAPNALAGVPVRAGGGGCGGCMSSRCGGSQHWEKFIDEGGTDLKTCSSLLRSFLNATSRGKRRGRDS
ncbi:histone deacetylase complex, catalytic component RPD3 [Mycena latifolia]|nr:histone deacetylase complex, catalytic component RPD3 [Mycena latifolia]